VEEKGKKLAETKGKNIKHPPRSPKQKERKTDRMGKVHTGEEGKLNKAKTKLHQKQNECGNI